MKESEEDKILMELQEAVKDAQVACFAFAHSDIRKLVEFQRALFRTISTVMRVTEVQMSYIIMKGDSKNGKNQC